MKEITFYKRAVPTKEQADRIKHFMVQIQKFLTLTGLESEGHYCYAFDPGYSFSRGVQLAAYHIPADIMDQIVYALEHGHGR